MSFPAASCGTELCRPRARLSDARLPRTGVVCRLRCCPTLTASLHLVPKTISPFHSVALSPPLPFILPISSFFTRNASVSLKSDSDPAAGISISLCACAVSQPYDTHTWLPDGYSQIFRSYVFGPSGFLDYGSATLCCKI